MTSDPSLSTELNALDRRLGGGFTPGSLITIRAPAHVQSEEFVETILTANPPSIHATTLRPAQTVRYEYSTTMGPDSERMPNVRGISRSSLFADASETLEHAKEVSLIAFDPVDELEAANGEQYQDFLQTAAQVARAEGCAIVFHAYDRPDTQTDARRRTLGVADTVLTITEDIAGSKINYFMEISRNRLGPKPAERLKFQIDDGVEIDTSRDIA